MKKCTYLLAALLAVGCGGAEDLSENEIPSPGGMSAAPVCFGVAPRLEESTKAPVEVSVATDDSVFFVSYCSLAEPDSLASTKAAVVTSSNLSSFYVNTTSGGSENIVSTNTVFSGSPGGNYSGGMNWPSSDRNYHFYASNSQLKTGSDYSKIVCAPDKDIIYSCQASPVYKSLNNLVFGHVYARVGGVMVKAPSGMTATLKSAVLTARKSGTFDTKTASWTATSPAEAVSLASSNDAWVVPGNYALSVTYDISTGVVTLKDVVKSGTVTIAGNKVNNITANVPFEDYIYSYGLPYGLTVSCADIPASGGTRSTATVAGTCKQKVLYASGREEEVTVTAYTASWSTAVSAPSLGTTLKARTKLGSLTLTYTANGQSNTACCDVYQQQNKIESTSYGAWTYGAKQYGTTTYGSKSYGATTYGDKSYGEWSFGSKSYGADYAGPTTYGAEYLASKTTGPEYGAGKSYGAEYAGAKSYGATSYGSWTSGTPEYGSSRTETRNYTASINASSTSVSPAGGSVTLSYSASHEARTARDYSIPKSRTVCHPWTRPIYEDWTNQIFRDDVEHYAHDGTTTYYHDYTRTKSRTWTRPSYTAWTRSTSTPWTRNNTRTRTDTYSSGVSAGSTDTGSDSGTDTGAEGGTDTGTDSGTDSGTDTGTEISRYEVNPEATRDVTKTIYIRTDSGTETVRTESGSDTETETGTPEAGTDYSSWSSVADTPSISGSSAGFSRSGATVLVSSNPGGGARSATYYATNNGATDNVTITQVADYISDTEYSISPISLSRNYFTPEGGTATISGGEGTITYHWASGRTTYGSFTPVKSTNNTWSSVSGSTLTVGMHDNGFTENLFVMYRHPDGYGSDVKAYYTQVGITSLTASVSRSLIYYGQSTTVTVTVNYTDGTSADVTGRTNISVPVASVYTSVSGSTYTHNKSGQTTNFTLNGTASFMGKNASFSFVIGKRYYDTIEAVRATDGKTSTKPSFRARWNDTQAWDSMTNGNCDYWTVDGNRIEAGTEALAKNYSGDDITFTIHYTNQIGATLHASIYARVSGGRWYYN